MDQNQVFDSTETSAVPKFSRYRSVRRAAVKDVQSTSPPPLPVSKINKTPSRYHRNQRSSSEPSKSPIATSQSLGARNGHAINYPEVQQLQEGPRSFEVDEKDIIRSNHVDKGDLNSKKASIKETRIKHDSEKRLHSQNSRGVSSGSWASSGVPAHQAAREEARMILEGEMDRLNKLKKQQANQRLMQAQTSNVPAHQDKVQQTNKNNDGDRVQISIELKKRTERIKDDEVRNFDQMSNAKHTNTLKKAVIGGLPILSSREDTSQPIDGQLQASQAAELSYQQTVGTGDVGSGNVRGQAKPTFDVPLSAVNAGDRRVQVRRNEALITLPITPTTTVKHILNSASTCVSDRFDPSSAVLAECFSQLGLERPLRRYERIRDVLNSWDNDSVNYLVVLTGEEATAVGTEFEDVPKKQPLDVSLQMYHSSRPGKWDKRWVKLQADGQVTISKRANDTENTKICHLSDSDLYMPTKKQIKKLRPPKKICLAVKSQQKSAVFLNGANFAHFFCSNDKITTDQWYHAVQSWRSWYLVNILGEGGAKPSDIRRSVERPQRSSMAMSRDSVPYQLGSFKPLLEFNKLDIGSDEEANLSLNNKTDGNRGKPLLDFNTERRSLEDRDGSPKRHSRSQGLPPSSFPKKLGFDSTELKADATDEMQPFTGSGLLARSASRRSQSGQASGRGVRGIAGKPLVDISTRSKFTDGSLLRQVEAWYTDHGGAEPKIDREKRREAMTAVGENV